VLPGDRCWNGRLWFTPVPEKCPFIRIFAVVFFYLEVMIVIGQLEQRNFGFEQ